MMSNRTLKDVLDNLTSKKASERQEGVHAIRDVFAQNQVVAKFHLNGTENGNPSLWLPVFQALFTSVSIEREGMKKASSRAPWIRRISEASATIRWLTERAVPYMNKKVFSALIQHMIQMLPSFENRSELFQPIALDYAKSIKAIIAYTPHLEHLEAAQWVQMVEICFNVILGDPVRESFTEDDAMDESPTPAMESDEDMFDDDPLEEESEASRGSKKRLRRDPTPKPIIPPKSFKGRKRNLQTVVTSEQVEFASILSILVASPTSPILSKEFPHLVAAIMFRLHRFLERYPADSSLLYDYINTVSSILEHLSLNRKYHVEVFARSAWAALVGLWGTKDKHLKGTLAVVLRRLFQFVSAPLYPDGPKLPLFDLVGGIGDLWHVLDVEAENKWGMDGLSCDALRLEATRSGSIQPGEGNAFVAKTFRAGWNFDAEQALFWAILELRADCAGKLFELSESMQHSTPIPSSSRAQSKRIKLDNPVASLLHSMQIGATVRAKIYHLQTLLFFVDRHWSLVHDALKREIIDVLLQHIAHEDNTVQSWVFLNFAAIAFAEAERSNQSRKIVDGVSGLNASIWDPIWAHAIRRANAPNICRAACHTAQILLTSFHTLSGNPTQVLLTSSRVLLDIETFTKDMDVQGPSFPFDSVCIFLSHCLTISSQDSRLYRLHLEDSVLSWLIDNWKVSADRSKMTAYTAGDIIVLLETICGLSKRIYFDYRPLLPKSEIVDSIVQENKTKVVHDFLLYAKVPPFLQEPHVTRSFYSLAQQTRPPLSSSSDLDKVPVMARGKERRISAFFLKTLEALTAVWGNIKDQASAEMVRQALDISLTAVIFETLLSFNGFHPNKQVLSSASSVINALSKSLENANWTTGERLLVTQALELIIQREERSQDDAFDLVLLQPGPDSGIKKQTLRRLLSDHAGDKRNDETERLCFLRLVWQHLELKDALKALGSVMRGILEDIMSPNGSPSHATKIDDKDGFGPIRTANAQESNTANMQKMAYDRPTRDTVEICIGFLACGPSDTPFVPQKEQELVKLIRDSAESFPENFCVVCPIYFRRVRQGMFTFPLKFMSKFLDLFGRLVNNYRHRYSEAIQCVLVDLLTCCLGSWRSTDVTAATVHHKFSLLCDWLAKELTAKKIKLKSWLLRDTFVRFLDRYLSEDPTEESWIRGPVDDMGNNEPHSGLLPSTLLPTLNEDVDTRVRFRAALVNARLYGLSCHLKVAPLVIYDQMKDFYVKDVTNYEHMLTRILSLGNIMIVSSAVRRGPYWHLLETCIFSKHYISHMESIFTGISERLGLSSLSDLFAAYASQIAFTIRQAKADITTFPPRLLGYKDRRQSAEAAFALFTPTNLLNDGRRQFESHCNMLQKNVTEGLQECFGETVGLGIAMWFSSQESDNGLEKYLKDCLSPAEDFWTSFENNLDRVITTILQCLGEQDFSEMGSIYTDLRNFDQEHNTKSAPVFLQLNIYRLSDSFKPHTPNLPIFQPKTILSSLHWISSRLPEAFTKATTYHVLHLLMEKTHSTPLVNEQHRLVNAITLWMAYRCHDMNDLTILNTIIHRAALLLSQLDLTYSAQSILELAFRYYKELTFDKSTGDLKSRLPNFLLRICCVAHDYASVADDRYLGLELLNWIDKQADLLSRTPILQPVISRALAAWPHQPSAELLPLYDKITLSDLTSILEDPYLSSNKFRLVRRIKDQMVACGGDANEYSKFYFWRLKECMPPPDSLQDEDIDAFTRLLTFNHGRISVFNPEPVNRNAARPRQRRMFKKCGAAFDALASDAITTGLLSMLEDDDATLVSSAYHTLRMIMAISSPEDHKLTPPEYRVEVEYLRYYKPFPARRPVPNFEGTLFSEMYFESATDFKKWVSLLTILFSDTLTAFKPLFGQLAYILTSDADFAEQVLPILVYTLLSLQKKLDHYTKPIRQILSDYFTAILESKQTDLACVRSIVDVVLHLRYFTPKTNDALAYNKWLCIDYTLLAQSAVKCGAYTTALLFVEIAADSKETAGDVPATEQVLYEIYAHIDEPDGFYGIQTGDLHQFLLKRLHHENQWDKAFRFHGAALEAGKTTKGRGEGLTEAFHHFGFDRLAMDTLRNQHGDSAQSSLSMNYKLAWRTETWDLPEQAHDAENAALYRTLRSVHRERDPSLVDGTIHSSFLEEMSHLRSLGSENLVEIRSVTRDLMCLGQVLKWRHETTQQQLSIEDTTLDNWKDFIHIDPAFEFSDSESLMATRISLIRSVRQREERQQIGTMVKPLVKGLINIEKHCLLHLSQAARTSDQMQIALNSVIRAQHLEATPTPDVSEEFANVLWMHKEEKLAVEFLRHLVNSYPSQESAEDSIRRSIWLSRLGTWTSEACLEKPAEIWEHYFDPAISLLEGAEQSISRSDSARAKIYRECAMFSERQYHSTLRSPDAIRWKVYVDRKTQELRERQKELDSMDKNSSQYKTKEGERRKAKRVFDEDSQHFNKHNTLRDTSLRQAIDMHSRCLESSNEFDNDSAIRLCSLWLANFDDKSILDCVNAALDRIPSRKFAFLAHQLTARLATIQPGYSDPPQENLQKLIHRICHEHPFHILYQVYCLADHVSLPPGSSRRSLAQSQSTQTERGTAAGAIFDRLRNDEKSGQRVRDVEMLCDAYLEWAKYPLTKKAPPKAKGGRMKIPSQMKILNISNLRVPVSTARTPLDPTMQYKDCVWIRDYLPEYETAGGINLPKINICRGSDGVEYKQLFKGEGNDDLRQDAVMEQVFDLVNGVLKHDRETRRRDLHVRDYKVIPLASQAGLLEFVGNTTPLRDWLLKAHPIYRRDDMKYSDVSLSIKRLTERYPPPRPEEKLAQFLQIREKFKPVLRHYFTEKHKTPINWFQMRLAYTRSVATTSIVGHILGLGDRHSSNILLDNVSGEVVHIDLGIAFDQGKLLGIPEKVPFRMTADIVDGMGPSGTAGVFQRCAEETLRVLREESEVIMTVLEVFKHDPLHSWTASEYKVKQAQVEAPTSVSAMNDASRFNVGIGIDMTSGSADEAADRALSSVARKLDKSLSVESTVNELLAEATDPMNLAMLYVGWGAHL